MRTKTIVCVATLVCAAVAAGIWLGYHQGGTSTVSPPLEGSSPPMTNDPSREYKTVKKEFSQDSATSVEQMKPATAVLLVGYGNKSAEIQPLQPPALALPKIKLVGITTISGNKRALLKVESPDNSPGPTQSLILGEHQRSGQVEVLEIDEKSGSVRVGNSDVVTLLTFERTPPEK